MKDAVKKVLSFISVPVLLYYGYYVFWAEQYAFFWTRERISSSILFWVLIGIELISIMLSTIYYLPKLIMFISDSFYRSGSKTKFLVFGLICFLYYAVCFILLITREIFDIPSVGMALSGIVMALAWKS